MVGRLIQLYIQRVPDHLFDRHHSSEYPLHTLCTRKTIRLYCPLALSPQRIPAPVAITTCPYLLAQRAICRPGRPAGSRGPPVPARLQVNTLRLQRVWPTPLQCLCPDSGPHERRVPRLCRIPGHHWIASRCPTQGDVQPPGHISRGMYGPRVYQRVVYRLSKAMTRPARLNRSYHIPLVIDLTYSIGTRIISSTWRKADINMLLNIPGMLWTTNTSW